MFSLSYANCGADFTDTLMNLGMGEAGESQLLRDITGVQIDLLVFHAAPEPLHEHFVTPAAFAVHTNLDVVVFQHVGKVRAGKLTALVGVEDFRRTVTVDCFLHCFNAKVGRQRVGMSREIAAEF